DRVAAVLTVEDLVARPYPRGPRSLGAHMCLDHHEIGLCGRLPHHRPRLVEVVELIRPAVRGEAEHGDPDALDVDDRDLAPVAGVLEAVLLQSPLGVA